MKAFLDLFLVKKMNNISILKYSVVLKYKNVRAIFVREPKLLT